MSRAVPIPVGDHPAWEHEDQSMNVERAPWHSVADSLVVLQSLKQSRERWLSTAFPKLPKPRGPKHGGHNNTFRDHLTAHGKFELSVGPHIFPNTEVFEVVYSHANDHNSTTYAPTEFQRVVDELADKDPELKQLWIQARTQPVPDTHWQNIGKLLAGKVPPGFSALYAESSQIRTQAWDIVVEFGERRHDQRIFPRGSVQPERIHETSMGRRFDVMIITTLPYTRQQVGADLQASGQQDTLTMPNHEDASLQPVTFHMRNITQSLYDLLLRWSSESPGLDPAATGNQLSTRAYLPYQLPDGELIGMIRTALALPYPMKSIRPTNADSGRTKRKVTRRKSAVEKSTAPAIPSTKPVETPAPSMGGHFSTFSVVQMSPPPPVVPAPPVTYSPPAPPPVAYSPSPVAYSPPVPPAVVSTTDAHPIPPHYRASTSTFSPTQPQAVASTPLSDRTVGTPPSSYYRAHTATTPITQSHTPIISHNSAPQPTAESSAAPSLFAQHRIRALEAAPTKRKKTKFEPPPPACKACHRSNVQLIHGGWYCRECVEARRFIVPQVIVPQRPPNPPQPASTAAPSTQRRPAHSARSSSESQSLIVPGTQFNHWTPPSH